MKVLLKILKKNVRNSIVCFMSTILTAIILFVFLGVKELVLGTMSMEERVRSQQGVAIQTYMYILLFIGLILISYTVSNYSRIRIKDYGMFMVFGEEKKDIIRMIILEYGIICGISWLIGCVLGTPFVILLQSIFRKEGIQTVQDPCWFLKNIGSTCFYMCVILCIAVIMNIIKIQNNSLASLLNTEQKRGTVPSVKASVIGAIAGLICFVFAIIFFSKVPMTYPRMKYGVLFSLTGLYLWFTYLGNVILRWVKKKEKWYDRHILTLKTLYHRFSENKNIILIVFIINVFVWVIVNINIIEYGNLSSEYLWKYPYNYVCMTEEKYTDEIHKVIKEPDEKIDEYAYIPLISNDGGEYVGISEDSYNKLTKNKKEHIKQGEVKAVLEKSKQDDENMFQDKHVYLKTATGMCKFAIKKEVKEVLFVAQQSDIIRILVMNNSDFDMLRSLQKKNTVIMTQQTEKETAIDEGKLKVCEKKYEIIGFYKGSLMKEDRQDDLTTLIFYICIGAFLIISGIMILSIKIWSDISNVSMKYGFLKKIGMETKEIKKNVKKELSLSLWIVFILSIVISGGALSYITWNVDWLLKKQVLITFFALLLFQAGYIILLREYGWRLANQQIQSERREKIWK